ncbi:ABC transporter ATP-binding protein [Salinispora cortesiana]|uniref:ABC transporter ATP-binding protein n=1 Tax=Salinispora cortesiana TaxID=1305843 RepID=UPI0012BCFEBF|nr:ABC transporter ATP-binding protein [Salinispora cortesiana]
MGHEYAIQVRGLRKSYGKVEVLRGVDLDVPRGTLLALLDPNGSGKSTVVKALSTLTRPSRGSVVVNGHGVMRRRNGVRSSIGMVSQFVALDWLHSGREIWCCWADSRSSARPAPPAGQLSEGITILLTTQYLEEADRLADQIAVLNDGRIIARGTADQLKQGVGRERASVVLNGPEDYRRADDLLAGPGLTRDPETRTISLAIDGPARVKQLLDLLAEHGLAIDSLSLTKPTLDDVFFALTQRATDTPDPDPMPARHEPNDELGAAR